MKFKSLAFKILFLVSFFIILVFIILFGFNYYLQHESNLKNIEENAQKISNMMAIAIEEPMSVGDDEGTTKKFMEVSQTSKDTRIFLTNFKGNITYSTDPELLRIDAKKINNVEEQHILEQSLQKDIKTGSLISVEDKDYFIEVKSIINKPECHHCHGSNRKILGSMIFRQNITPQIETMVAIQTKSAGIFIAGLCLLLFVIFIFLRKTIISPIKKIGRATELISQGNLDTNVEVNSNDELGQLAKSVNMMSVNMQSLVKDIISGVHTLAKSSNSLSALSTQMSVMANDNSQLANNVSYAAEEMSSSMDAIAAAMEQSSVNISTVAAGGEEMSVTIEEIAKNTASANTVVHSALDRTQRSSEEVTKLGQSATEINVVVEAITRIAAQTNLLSLNASIEAAKAGESGKGFAVVANEIKELSRQSAEAADEIKQKIKSVQGAVFATIDEVNEVLSTINDINSIVTVIAASVEEQSVTTKDMAENIGQASQGVDEINTNVAQSSVASKEVASEVAKISASSQDMSQGSSMVSQSSEELSLLAQKLETLVKRFKV